jgi:hypothetical protein
VLRGTASNPRLLFDRREVILPVVPLDTTSKSSFRIINEGYTAVNLKIWAQDEDELFNIKVNMIDGSTLGKNRLKMKVEVSFKSSFPISFTTKLFIEDD